MKSSGVLATLMLAAVAGYASAQGTCDQKTDGTNGGAVTDAECAAVAAAENVGTATPGATAACVATCAMSTGADKTACCTDTPFTFDWIYTGTFPGCTSTEGTTAVETTRTGQCEQTVPTGAEGTDATAAKCTNAIGALTETCPAIPNTCANAVSAGSAFVCSTHATLKTQKAGATACAVTSGTPDTCVAADCCELPACTASADTAKDGTGDGAFYCINGGTIAGAAGSCTCGSCSTGYSGANCATAATCTAVDTPMAGCVVPDCTAVDTPYAGCTVLACTAADTPWVGCTPPACTSSAILPWEPCTPKACTAVDTPWVGCTPPACTAVDTPYAGCTPPACTAVDTPYAGCTTPDCTDTDTPYAGCTAVTCAKDKSVTSKACVACATGKVNAAGDDQFGADTTCTTKPAPAAAASGAATAAVSLTALLALVLA